MYTNIKSVQYLVAMLKKRDVTTAVVSPGTSHDPIVRSIEEDGSFTTYSITDERSAAFFAIGLAQQLNKPIAIMCTSGTASYNYISGVTEAYRRNIPLVVITADKPPHFLGQQMDQMVNQPCMFREITRHSVSLPEITTSRDDWFCRRVLNEVFLELDHHGCGPVHINVPIGYGMFAIGDVFTTSELPEINIIERLDSHTPAEKWKEVFGSLDNKNVMLQCGQNYSFSEEETVLLDVVSKGYNCILAVDTLSNLHLERSIPIARLMSGKEKAMPDILITIGGNSAFKWPGIREAHWRVDLEGKVVDTFCKQKYVIELSSVEFLRLMAQHAKKNASDAYFRCCKNIEARFTLPELPYSSLYACKEVLAALPENSILNLGNSTTIRVAQYFDIPKSVKVYCNRGVNGIDGCMSTFIGQSAVAEELSFLLIGDLTFFYDMNALWNRYVGKNVRIMLFNNGGASLFHHNQGKKAYPTINENVAATHHATAKGWCESLGMHYLTSSNKEEFDAKLKQFVSADSDRAIIFEVMTDCESDGAIWRSIYAAQPQQPRSCKSVIKSVIKKVIR